MRSLPIEQEGCQKGDEADSANLLDFPNKNPNCRRRFHGFRRNSHLIVQRGPILSPPQRHAQRPNIATTIKGPEAYRVLTRSESGQL